MTEVIDLTGSDPADEEVVAMEVDTGRPESARPASAAPSLPTTEDAGAAAPPAAQPKPKKDQQPSTNDEGGQEDKGEGQRKPPRYSQREKRPARAKTAAVELAAGLPQHLPTRMSGRPTLQAMQAHLDTIQIGLRPRDPTVGSLPAELPPPMHPLPPDARTMDLNAPEWTQERINAEAATTVPGNLWAALLEEPPGVPADRLGRYTGQERQERRRAAVAADAPNGTANGGLPDGLANGTGGGGGG